MSGAQVADGDSATRAQVAEGDSATRTPANALRGETSLVVAGQPRTLRPTFAALVAAEEELGPLFALVERAAEGKLRLAEVAALFWHCLADRGGLTREMVGEALMAQGLAASAKPLRTMLGAILQGRG